MAGNRRLFDVTQWALRGGIVLIPLIGMFALGVAATIFGLASSRLPLDKIVRAKTHNTVHVPITGLFAVLSIFVLAQIFRRGSDMRAELAGTI
jgi:hypothetical protein